MRIDISLLRQLAESRLISIQQHEKYPLLIHNYTPLCQYSRAWDEVTMMCRGLITDLEGNIVSRPFSKFFNLSEHFGDDCKLPPINWKQKFTVTEKMDGSLGILYRTPEGFKIATRGSFASEQAIIGTKLLGRLKQNFDWNYTYLFEILYPQNRIVVDYGEDEDLVLLDVLDTHTGASVYDFERFSKELGCAAVFDLGMTKDQIENISGDNREGVVVRFEDGTRVKVKIQEYVRLHRLITGTNARSIWDVLRTHGSLSELLDRVPDEYYAWVQRIEAELLEKYRSIERCAFDDFLAKDPLWTRAQFAEYAKTKKYPHLLFAIMDNKNVEEKIWDLIYPPHTLPFHQDIDA